MKIEEFQENFKNKEVNTKIYIKVVTILLGIILLIVLLNNSLIDYYKVGITISKDKLEIITSLNDINTITSNNKIMIERNIFTYKIDEISDYINENSLYKIIKIKIENDKGNADKFMIDNNYIEGRIITNRFTIFEYLIKTFKGE